jgi:hypothetical protein
MALVMVLLLAVLHTPLNAQALMSSLLSDFFPFGSGEPAMLFLTGVALLSLSRIGTRR